MVLAKIFTSICNGRNVQECANIVTNFAKETNSKLIFKAVKTPENLRLNMLRNLGDTTLLSKVNNPKQFYTGIRDYFYEQIRAGKKLIYSCREGYNPKEFQEFLLRNSDGFYGKVQGAWMFRYQTNMDRNVKIADRLSLNVYQDSELTSKLDKYLSQNCSNTFYKCPGAGKIGWNSRHDTVTIYFPKPVSTKEKQEISQLVKPHIRQSADEIMLGNKVTEGVYQIEEPTLDTIKPLLVKAKMLKLEPEFYEWLGHPDFQGGAGLFAMNNGERVVHTSPGAVEALRQTLELIQKSM